MRAGRRWRGARMASRLPTARARSTECTASNSRATAAWAWASASRKTRAYSVLAAPRWLRGADSSELCVGRRGHAASSACSASWRCAQATDTPRAAGAREDRSCLAGQWLRVGFQPESDRREASIPPGSLQEWRPRAAAGPPAATAPPAAQALPAKTRDLLRGRLAHPPPAVRRTPNTPLAPCTKAEPAGLNHAPCADASPKPQANTPRRRMARSSASTSGGSATSATRAAARKGSNSAWTAPSRPRSDNSCARHGDVLQTPGGISSVAVGGGLRDPRPHGRGSPRDDGRPASRAPRVAPCPG